MHFRAQTTFNTHDTSLTTGSRITVENGVKKRCELVINRLLANPVGYTPVNLTAELNKRFPSANYSVTDITYVLRRLLTVNLVSRRGVGSNSTYRASKDIITKWRSIEKIVK